MVEEELQEGTCALIFNSEGNPARVALIVCLRVVRDDGLVLVQVAKLSKGRLVPKLQLPATKLKDGESIPNAAQRLLRSKLNEFGVAKGLGDMTQDEEVRVVAAYGLETKFLRTVIDVPFDASANEG